MPGICYRSKYVYSCRSKLFALLLITIFTYPTFGQVQVSTYTALRAPDGLARDAAGNIYASRYSFSGLSDVFKIDNEGNTVVFVDDQAGPAGMAFDESGALYLSRYNNSDVVKIDEDGNVVEVVASGIGGPIGLDFDSQGNLYVNHNVELFFDRIDTTGNQSLFANHGVFNTSSLTIDDNDNIYIANYTNGIITRTRTSDRTTSTFVDLGVGGIGFILYSNGHFYATAIQDHLILRISMDGVADTLAGDGIAGVIDGLGETARFNRPNGITASPDGDTLFVAQANHIRMITGVRTDISAQFNNEPQGFSLDQNYPNPFNPSTTIAFTLPHAKAVNISIFNVQGQLVRDLVTDSRFPAGPHELQWNGSDNAGKKLPSGMYLYRITAGEFSSAKRMMLLK